MRTKLGVFFGGKSVEHEVSIITAIQAMESLDIEKYEIIPVYITKDNRFYTGEHIRDVAQYKNIPELLKRSTRVLIVGNNGQGELIQYPMKKFGNNTVATIEIAFLAGHGTNVEDGVLQGFFQSQGITYTGCDVCSAANGMNKYITKLIMRDAGVPVLPAVRLSTYDYTHKKDETLARIEETFPYPVIVKPINLGSSIGIKIAHDRDGLIDAIEYAFMFSTEILLEKAIKNLREINVSVLGDADEAIASECEEPITVKEILDFEEKYLRGSKKSGSKGGGMASLSRKIPADIPDVLRETIRSLAVTAFKAAGCNGVTRVDFMLDCDTDEIYLTELNTLPGSLAFYLWKPVGIEYSELLNRIISLALKRRRENDSVNFSFESNILSGYTGGSKGSKGKL